MKYKGYVGTYTSKNSEGIYSFDFENDVLNNVELFAKVKNPKYLTFVEDYICAVCDYEHKSGVSLFDKTGKEVNKLEYEDSTSCFVDYKDGYIYSVNYHEGTFSVVKVDNGELNLVKKVLIKEKAGCHQVLFYNDKFLIPCLFLDKIVIINKNYEIEGSIDFEVGSGVRHGIFSDDNKYLYVIGELSNYLYVVDLVENKIVNKIAVLENGESHLKDSAAIRMKGNYIYVSTRTKDVISVIYVVGKELTLKQVVSSRGLHPRDFVIVDENIIVANRLSNDIAVLKIKDGLICDEESIVSLPEGISIIMEVK